MASHNPDESFHLTRQQEELLFAALGSQSASSQSPPLDTANSHAMPLPSDLAQGPDLRDAQFDYEFGFPDSSLDLSFNADSSLQEEPAVHPAATQVVAQSDSPVNTDAPDKRSLPDDDDQATSAAKRRSAEQKAPKKPGRKPLLSEPTNKRKAQNRAAQRAFRERKEKHVRDLEIKVEELQKATDEMTTENSKLRGELRSVTSELEAYRKHLPRVEASSRIAANINRTFVNRMGDLDFQFEFPTFGVLPGPVPYMPPTPGQSDQASPPAGLAMPFINNDPSGKSPFSRLESSNQVSPGTSRPGRLDLAPFLEGFTPQLTTGAVGGASGTRPDGGDANATSSPSASSASNVGNASSTGTTPEPSAQSPASKPPGVMATIGEEPAPVSGPDSTWLAPENFQFDPQIFGDYRDPQNNIMSNLPDNFFDDSAGDIDFLQPYNMQSDAASQATARKDICAEIDAAKEKDDSPLDTRDDFMDHEALWNKIQECPHMKAGNDFDLDALCSELQKKAKCSSSGKVVKQADFTDAIAKFVARKAAIGVSGQASPGVSSVPAASAL